MIPLTSSSLFVWIMEKNKTDVNVTITLFFFYKNTLYENKEAQNDPKSKNLRTTPASKYAKFLEQWAWGLVNIKIFRTTSLNKVRRQKFTLKDKQAKLFKLS